VHYIKVMTQQVMSPVGESEENTLLLPNTFLFVDRGISSWPFAHRVPKQRFYTL
jgi:hypothetical protein